MLRLTSIISLIIIYNAFSGVICALPDPGRYHFAIHDNDGKLSLEKSLYKGSQLFIHITCEPTTSQETNVTIIWNLIRSACWDFEENWTRGKKLINGPMINNVQIQDNETFISVQSKIESKCKEHIILPRVSKTKVGIGKNTNKDSRMDVMPTDDESESNKKFMKHPKGDIGQYVYEVDGDGLYLLILEIKSSAEFNATVDIEMLGRNGYLSAVDWPLLPFYGCMCIVYVLFGSIWLLVSFLQWRDLLRIQFWIGGVILLGMLEKATFYAEYRSVNTSGVNVEGAMILAEWVSCGKRTLARMLVIIVSLGFGIVKPRLGPMLHRVVGAGVLYFILAAIESYLRVMHKQNDRSREILIASIPLAILDSAICWWIFTSLVQTTRTLRLRRNMVKLSLYKHFTNTLVFSVIASVIFMIYSIRAHKLAVCLRDWKELWVDEAYWHILFSVILLVIMILWRPTNNNQRYAFTPLLDNPEDDDDDEEDQFVSDAYGVKVRFHNRSSSPKPKSTTSAEEDIRWIEDNIPTSMGDPTLPILDSDEEIMNTKFEVSKMQ